MPRNADVSTHHLAHLHAEVRALEHDSSDWVRHDVMWCLGEGPYSLEARDGAVQADGQPG